MWRIQTVSCNSCRRDPIFSNTKIVNPVNQQFYSCVIFIFNKWLNDICSGNFGLCSYMPTQWAWSVQCTYHLITYILIKVSKIWDFIAIFGKWSLEYSRNRFPFEEVHHEWHEWNNNLLLILVMLFYVLYFSKTVKDARRSLSFDVSTSLEDQDTTKDIEEHAQMSVERMPAEAQLRKDCEILWQELNSVSSARTGWCCCVCICVFAYMYDCVVFLFLLKLDYFYWGDKLLHLLAFLWIMLDWNVQRIWHKLSVI